MIEIVSHLKLQICNDWQQSSTIVTYEINQSNAKQALNFYQCQVYFITYNFVKSFTEVILLVVILLQVLKHLYTLSYKLVETFAC